MGPRRCLHQWTSRISSLGNCLSTPPCRLFKPHLCLLESGRCWSCLLPHGPFSPTFIAGFLALFPIKNPPLFNNPLSLLSTHGYGNPEGLLALALLSFSLAILHHPTFLHPLCFFFFSSALLSFLPFSLSYGLPFIRCPLYDLHPPPFSTFGASLFPIGIYSHAYLLPWDPISGFYFLFLHIFTEPLNSSTWNPTILLAFCSCPPFLHYTRYFISFTTPYPICTPSYITQSFIRFAAFLYYTILFHLHCCLIT